MRVWWTTSTPRPATPPLNSAAPPERGDYTKTNLKYCAPMPACARTPGLANARLQDAASVPAATAILRCRHATGIVSGTPRGAKPPRPQRVGAMLRAARWRGRDAISLGESFVMKSRVLPFTSTSSTPVRTAVDTARTMAWQGLFQRCLRWYRPMKATFQRHIGRLRISE